MNLPSLLEIVADSSRLRILNLLSAGTLCVCDIVEVLRLGQSNLSKHLRILRDGGLVRGLKKGMFVYYSLSEPADFQHRTLLNALLESCKAEVDLLDDIVHLKVHLRQKENAC